MGMSQNVGVNIYLYDNPSRCRAPNRRDALAQLNMTNPDLKAQAGKIASQVPQVAPLDRIRRIFEPIKIPVREYINTNLLLGMGKVHTLD
jgi:hypothetical protein